MKKNIYYTSRIKGYGYRVKQANWLCFYTFVIYKNRRMKTDMLLGYTFKQSKRYFVIGSKNRVNKIVTRHIYECEMGRENMATLRTDID